MKNLFLGIACLLLCGCGNSSADPTNSGTDDAGSGQIEYYYNPTVGVVCFDRTVYWHDDPLTCVSAQALNLPNLKQNTWVPF